MGRRAGYFWPSSWPLSHCRTCPVAAAGRVAAGHAVPVAEGCAGGDAPPCEVGRHQPLGRPRGHGPAAVEEFPPLAAMGAAGDAHRPFSVPHQPAEGDRAGGEGGDDRAVVVVVHGGDRAPTVCQIANGGCTAPWRSVEVVHSRGRKLWGPPPGLAAPRLVRARVGGGVVSPAARR